MKKLILIIIVFSLCSCVSLSKYNKDKAKQDIINNDYKNEKLQNEAAIRQLQNIEIRQKNKQ